MLQRAKKERNILHTTKRSSAKWIGYILRRNCLLKHVIEGKIEGRIQVTWRRGRRCKRPVDGVNERSGVQFSLIYLFISLLYMFRASTCPSTGENCCICATLLFVTLKGGSFKLQRLLLHKIQGVADRQHPVFYVIITFVIKNYLLSE